MSPSLAHVASHPIVIQKQVHLYKQHICGCTLQIYILVPCEAILSKVPTRVYLT